MGPLTYRRHRFPASIIQHAVWLYLRFTLSYRDVEELLVERGLDLSYETVRSWVLKFGPLIARRLRQRRPRPVAAKQPHGRVFSRVRLSFRSFQRLSFRPYGSWLGRFLGLVENSNSISSTTATTKKPRWGKPGFRNRTIRVGGTFGNRPA